MLGRIPWLDKKAEDLDLVPEPIYYVRNPNVPLALSAMIKTHTVIKTEVVQADSGKYAVRFTYDDGTEETAIVGKQLTAEFYAKNQLGEIFPVGVNPLLLNAKKADELRQRRT